LLLFYNCSSYIHFIKYYIGLVQDLAREENSILKKQREVELLKRKKKYRWQIFGELGLPSGIDDTIDDIPADEEFTRAKNIDFYGSGVEAVAKLELVGVFEDVNDLSDYAKFAKTLHPDKAIPLYEAGRWTSDVEFGRQIMNGVNPMMIRKCTEIPKKFPVTNAMIMPYLTRGFTLEQEIEVSLVQLQEVKKS